MFTLQKLNVVRIVATEGEKTRLLAEGFKEKIEEEVKKTGKKGKE